MIDPEDAMIAGTASLTLNIFRLYASGKRFLCEV